MIKKYFTIRVIILLIVLVMMIFAINPGFSASSIEVRTAKGEVAEQGLTKGDAILSINRENIQSVEQVNSIIADIGVNDTLIINTDSREIAYLTNEKPDFSVMEVNQKSNVELGLDLSGGTRVLLRPDVEGEVSNNQINNLMDVLNNRLNTYGLSDLQMRTADDQDGNKLVLVEIAGASRQEVVDLVEQQGEFEARIGEEIVFVGSERDITFVCKDDGTCSGIRSCDQDGAGGYFCNFQFDISLSVEAAKRHADITKDIPVNASFGTDVDPEGQRQGYLSQPLDLYLDGTLVNSLRISEGLKGVETTGISISGSGSGGTEKAAYDNALGEMNKLQTILITGSLPFKLKIEKLDSISPILGADFIKNAFLIGILAILSVSVVVFIRYRKFKIVIPMLITMFSEVIIIFGVAALIKWRIDVVSIAGIIAAVGTGVDDQIVITDEVLKGEERAYNWKQRIKRAFFIIFTAYVTTLAALIPLWNAGAGLIRGFALTTIVGITVGVFITRPAFASLVEKLLNE